MTQVARSGIVRTMSDARAVIGELNGSLVLVRQDEAEWLARVHRALNTTSTWGEFLDAVGDDQHMREQLQEWELDPDRSDAFDRDAVPGVSDGDWPAWPQQEMLTWLPDAVRDLGTVEASRISGDALELPPGTKPEVVKLMTAAGYEVVEDQALVEVASGY